MQTKPNTTKKVFFSGVLLLTLSTVLVKVVGLVYKIPMLSYLGSEGMGYFHSAYEIYAVFCIIATAGLPVALSVLISASLAEVVSYRNRQAPNVCGIGKRRLDISTIPTSRKKSHTVRLVVSS